MADTVGVEPESDLFDDLLNADDPRPIVRPVRPTAKTEADGAGPDGVDATRDTAPAPAPVPAPASEPDRSAAPDGAAGRADPGAPPDDDASFPALMALLDAPSEDVAERTALQSYLRRQPRSAEEAAALAPDADSLPAEPGAEAAWSWSPPSVPLGDDNGQPDAAAPSAYEAPLGARDADDEQVILSPGPWRVPSIDDELTAWPPPAPGTAIAGIPLPAGVEGTGALVADPARTLGAVEHGSEPAAPVSRFASGLDDDLLPLRRR